MLACLDGWACMKMCVHIYCVCVCVFIRKPIKPTFQIQYQCQWVCSPCLSVDDGCAYCQRVPEKQLASLWVSGNPSAT